MFKGFKDKCAPSSDEVVKGSLCTRRQHSCAKIASDFALDGFISEGSLNCLDLLGGETSSEAYASLLRSPKFSRSLSESRQVQHHIVIHGHDENTYLGNLLVQMYVRCTDLDSAHFCFDKVHDRNLFTWNFLLRAFEGLGYYKEVLFLFEQMQVENVIPDKCSYVSILSAYATHQAALSDGKYLHARIIAVGLHLNFIVATALVNLYGKCEDIEHACSTFESLPEQDLVSWNALIAAFAQKGLDKEAFQTFEQLLQEAFIPDKVTLVHVLSAFARPAMLVCGKRIHASLHCVEIDSNVVVATALANMYGKCSNLKCARQLFYQMHVRNVVTWNAMIAVFAQHRQGKEALQIFNQMKLEEMTLTKVTFVSVLDACASERSLQDGQIIHILMTKFGFDVDVIVGTALVNMYNNCSNLQEGQRVFELLTERNVITWNVMMTGFVHHGYGKEAIQLFDRMEKERVVVDALTTIEVLSACGCEAALSKGQVIHCFVLFWGFEQDVVAANAILNMYGKCGCVDDACQIFERMQERSLVSWNCMIALHAQHGNEGKVLELFVEMQRQEKGPNETTLLNIMCMGSHAGLVTECVDFWIRMIEGQSVFPCVDHFDCMVDILGRAGQLEEAESLVKRMPAQPSALSWTTLLSACKSSADVTRGNLAAKASIELDTSDEVTYITLYNIYAASKVEDHALSSLHNI